MNEMADGKHIDSEKLHPLIFKFAIHDEVVQTISQSTISDCVE